ncbi:erythromycin esterase family protein [Aliikangiella sp. G2MR2-5]|uniref:erythromycin esterase family protein n=1 Tax=Aliikangiella sp. G2MR2-5 TaxID=2788943 RepID=UPI0018A940EB|nr:erythromycin esterase family protein [Aliikangiella sp. G2MR2-5]
MLFRIVTLVFLFTVSFSAISKASLKTTPIYSSELTRLLEDLCDKDIVILGEDANHGSAKTLKVKAQITRQLIETCNFNQLGLESQVYDLIDFSNKLHTGNASAKRLQQSVSYFLSSAKVLEEFFVYLFEEAQNSKLEIFGFDHQIGGRGQFFAQKELPDQLTRYLDQEKIECKKKITQLTQWQYTQETPFGKEVIAELQSCLDKIKTATQKFKHNEDSKQIALMNNNLKSFLDAFSGNTFNARDKAMFSNIVEYFSRPSLKSKKKLVIWTATIHALKSNQGISGQLIPMGQHLNELYEKSVARIGFTALKGSFGRGTKIHAVPKANRGALEQVISKNHSGEWIYLDNNALTQLGKVEAKLINYIKPSEADWSRLIDGVIVLDTEEAIK